MTVTTGQRVNKFTMADEVLFEFLHMEIVSYVQKSAKKDEKESIATKLESMGFRVGQRMIERSTRETPRFSTELDIIKFVCKDFWSGAFKKQIDNLRTNHQGVYVLQDNKFKLLVPMSAGKQYIESAPRYLAFTCGLIRGALSNVGMNCVVTAEVSTMPACKFQIMIQRS